MSKAADPVEPVTEVMTDIEHLTKRIDDLEALIKKILLRLENHIRFVEEINT